MFGFDSHTRVQIIMTTQNTLKIGDIITIGKSKTKYLVVNSEHFVSRDTIRNDDYWVDQIEVFKYDTSRYYCDYITDPKIEKFYFDDGCMSGKGKKIKKSDIKVSGFAKFSTETITNYNIKSVKKYSNVD